MSMGPRDRVCIVCGADFIGNRFSKYCSENCKKTAAKKRKEDEEKAVAGPKKPIDRYFLRRGDPNKNRNISNIYMGNADV